MNERELKKIFGPLILIMILLFLIWFFYSYITEGFIFSLFQNDFSFLEEKILSYGHVSEIAFILLVIMASVFAIIPSVVIYIVGGAVFGGFSAGCLAFLGNIIGAALGFQIANKFGREWLKKKIPKKVFDSLDKFSEKYGSKAIFILRINPLTSSDILNYACGFTKINFYKYLLWTLLAILPSIFIQTYLGKTIAENFIISRSILVLGIFYFIVFTIVYFITKKKKHILKKED